MTSHRLVTGQRKLWPVQRVRPRTYRHNKQKQEKTATFVVRSLQNPSRIVLCMERCAEYEQEMNTRSMNSVAAYVAFGTSPTNALRGRNGAQQSMVAEPFRHYVVLLHGVMHITVKSYTDKL